ncbi:hypothetical protein [Aureimonas sp. Leaf324]|jgi:hypothetical protein|uniref:hypothetical protein n=1 Tax=Aureimonas sp. Leaf324 TaxID=1736336 RepID=UPI0007015DBD|nr:hypothetical protein [Aureimonas sp. Leaf324]KQQ85886.1 hypothetical protein ASF65_04960 [Aureimonas sp. Leaf324]
MPNHHGWLPLFVAGLLLSGRTEAGEWTYERVQRTDGDMSIVVTSQEHHGFGLKCTSGGLIAQYLTDDPMNDRQLHQANADYVTLAIETDQANFRLAGELQRTAEGPMFVAWAGLDVLEALQRAKGQITLSLEVAGRRSHARSFPLQGASPVLASLARHCRSGPTL